MITNIVNVIIILATIITLKINTLTALGSMGGKAPRPPRPLKLSSRRLDLLPRVKVIIFFFLLKSPFRHLNLLRHMFIFLINFHRQNKNLLPPLKPPLPPRKPPRPKSPMFAYLDFFWHIMYIQGVLDPLKKCFNSVNNKYRVSHKITFLKFL